MYCARTRCDDDATYISLDRGFARVYIPSTENSDPTKWNDATRATKNELKKTSGEENLKFYN